MKKYNIYSGIRTGDTRYEGYMSFDDSGLVEMEIYPPGLFALLLEQSEMAKQVAEKRGTTVQYPDDIFMGAFDGLAAVDADEDTRSEAS